MDAAHTHRLTRRQRRILPAPRTPKLNVVGGDGAPHPVAGVA